jgi:hypothetical protein
MDHRGGSRAGAGQHGRAGRGGLAGLEDASRSGDPKTVLTDEAVGEILAATVTPPPQSPRAQGSRTGRAGGWRLAAAGEEDPGQPGQHLPGAAWQLDQHWLSGIASCPSRRRRDHGRARGAAGEGFYRTTLVA